MRRLKAILEIQDMDSMRLLRANLRAAGFEVSTASGGQEILDGIAGTDCDLLVVGEDLPDIVSLDFLELLRESSNIPAVVIGRAEDSVGVVAALNAGADDFIAYPYSTDEFFARVAAVVRRAYRAEHRADSGKKKIGNLIIDMSQRHVVVKGKATALTPTEYKLLLYMAERPDQVISHEELLVHVWGESYANYVHYLRVGVGRLRQKIEKDPSSPVYLVTCSGIGYMLQDMANR